MKTILFSLILFAASVFGQSTADDVVLKASQGTLAAGVATNIVSSFKPHTVGQVVPCSACISLDPGLVPPGQVMIVQYVKIQPTPIARTVGMSLGTAGVIVAEHFIVKKWPRSKRWVSVVNFGAGAVAGIEGNR